MISRLWLATRKTDGQDREKEEIFALWAEHLLNRRRSKEFIRGAMESLLKTSRWWPAIADFEETLDNWKPRRPNIMIAAEREAAGL